MYELNDWTVIEPLVSIALDDYVEGARDEFLRGDLRAYRIANVTVLLRYELNCLVVVAAQGEKLSDIVRPVIAHARRLNYSVLRYHTLSLKRLQNIRDQFGRVDYVNNEYVIYTYL